MLTDDPAISGKPCVLLTVESPMYTVAEFPLGAYKIALAANLPRMAVATVVSCSAVFKTEIVFLNAFSLNVLAMTYTAALSTTTTMTAPAPGSADQIPVSAFAACVLHPSRGKLFAPFVF